MFTITIVETKTVAMLSGKKWDVIGKKENGDDEYGYTPPIERPEEVETKIFEQVVQELDLPTVIKAVNKL